MRRLFLPLLLCLTLTEGDRGGNRFFVRVTATSAVVNLHSLWDGLLLGSQGYRDAGNVAIELRNRPEFAREKLAELAERDPETWSRESVELARTVGYRDGSLVGAVDRKEAPVLPEGYPAAAKAVAERRVVLAGLRLAETLRILSPQ